ncbi:MAG: GNAT family N-acetyltransferase [Natronospirillum sp.]|uniref:GNAT family N-acetyltransferase n=1 Tax=Natronospirillum sp. TaxID=2812955 RepID=UPI0025F9D01F|nr:GNAT family N-acetyltransferase [Natronospirillum sp.]MCH8552657.1 GNAT family N-acetyltransferase [Natronospirillum sp.]
MSDIHLREISASELDKANQLVVAAIQSWDMPPRLLRLVAGTHQYEAADFQTMRLFLLDNDNEETVGMLAVEDYPGEEAGCAERVLLLHGLYIHPEYHGRGFGRAAVSATQHLARDGGFAGVLIKAHSSAKGFFNRLGLQHLPVRDDTTDYPYRYWWPASKGQQR